MRILVPVKQVATIAKGDIAFDGAGRVAEEALEWGLNECDEFSLETALELAEGEEGGEVLAVSAGGEHAAKGLLACLAKGADRALRVADPALADADPLAVAAALAAVARAEAPDLILCGVQSSDAANAATGVALAGLLDLPRVAAVRAVASEGRRLVVQRELDRGFAEVLSLELPALLTIQTSSNEPRPATLRAIKRARTKPLETLDLAALGLDGAQIDAAGGSRTLRLSRPERGSGARVLHGSPSEIAAQIAEIVQRELA